MMSAGFGTEKKVGNIFGAFSTISEKNRFKTSKREIFPSFRPEIARFEDCMRAERVFSGKLRHPNPESG